jgi:RecA/RadA recombinase
VTSPREATQRSSSDEAAAEITIEQRHVDRVYAELENAALRAGQVEREGLARGRTSRVGDLRDEELTGLFERDALVYNAARRRHTLDSQYEGLVFGRLDLTGADGPNRREVRYIGRLGVRDTEYEPLVIDWRAPAASPFYRATPTDPHGVIRRRVLQCRGPRVVGVEDDLMVAEPPDDLVVVGDGALLAALTRSRGRQMRDIVATIQQHQDEAIRAPAVGVTEISGGPGTGKTVVALHRAAYLLYADRRRYETGGILVVGPSASYTAYIERVLPSLGEDTVTLRSVGDLVDAVTATRLDNRDAAAIKGSSRMRRVLSRLVREAVPGAPHELRVFVCGHAVRIEEHTLDAIRHRVLRQHQRNLAGNAVLAELTEAAYRQTDGVERALFVRTFEAHPAVEEFLAQWWPQLDPREILLWLLDETRAAEVSRSVLTPGECQTLVASLRPALDLGTWSVADVALVDDIAARIAPVVEAPREERGFYEIEALDDLDSFGVTEMHPSLTARELSPQAYVASADPRERLLVGRVGRTDGYAHILVDEAQDLSPMQWRMLGRRGRHASWTVVGDAAQSSWPDPEESAAAREDAFSGQVRRAFHMTTNYRNAREVFDYAADVIRAHVPDADIPVAVRETGVPVVELTSPGDLREAV